MKKRKIEIAVVSDVHLGSHGSRADELTTYLSSINPTKLVLNGDIIDFEKSKESFPGTHTKVLRKIMSMASKGTKVYYIPGACDKTMRKFNGIALGNLHICDHLELELDGKSACFLHGDFFETSLRYPEWLQLPLKVGNALIKPFAGLKSGKAQRSGVPFNTCSNEPSVKDESFQRYCVNIGFRNKLDFIVVGRTHRPEKKMFEGNGNPCTYLNSGDWVENLTALEYNFKRWKVYRYSHDKLSSFFLDEDLKELDIQELIANITSEKEKSKEIENIRNSEKEEEPPQD